MVASGRLPLVVMILGVLAVVIVAVALVYVYVLDGSTSFESDNQAPVIEGGSLGSPITVVRGQSVFLVTEWSDPDGDTLTSTWKVDGEHVRSNSPMTTVTSFTYRPNESISGDITIEVIVSDGELNTSHTWQVTVLIPNRCPIVVASVDTFDLKVGEGFSFDGSGCSDPDGDELEYLWLFGDGESSTDVSPRHLYMIPGSYNVTLNVSDDELNATATLDVNVTGEYLWKMGPLTESDTVKIMVVDVDDDGSEEMVVASASSEGDTGKFHGRIYIYDVATRALEWSSPDIGAINDFEMGYFDQDPAMEIVVGAMTEMKENGDMDGFGYVFDGISHEEEWRSVNVGSVVGVEIGNANDDPAMEAVFSYVSKTTFDWTTFAVTMKGGITVLGADYIDRWRSSGYGATDILFVGDLDGDSDNELLISTTKKMGLADQDFKTSVLSWNGRTYVEVLSRDDLLLEGTVVADLDRNGDMEIIAEESSEGFDTMSGNVTVYNHVLTAIWTTEDIGAVFSLAVGDLDKDGELEILAGGVEGETALEDGRTTFNGHMYI
ncbi:MAG: PKD domain-containing protein, partial [Thermoplasmata archaeon]|nr:PKD domain-containing protein [Thermoplasmata archaeon]